MRAHLAASPRARGVAHRQCGALRMRGRQRRRRADVRRACATSLRVRARAHTMARDGVASGSRTGRRRSPTCCGSARRRRTLRTMPSFRYEALDPSGRSRSAASMQPSARAARDQLRAQGLAPVAVDESEAARFDTIALVARASVRRRSASSRASSRRCCSRERRSSRRWPPSRSNRIVAARAGRSSACANRSSADRAWRRRWRGQPQTYSPLYRGLASVGAETGQLGQVSSRGSPTTSRRGRRCGRRSAWR